MSDLFGLTEDQMERVTAAVLYVEANARGPRPVAWQAVDSAVEGTFVRITGALSGGLYPGVVTWYSASAAAWTDGATVKVLPLNGEALVNASRYPARPSGQSGSDLVYVVTDTPAAGGGGGAITVTDGTTTVTGVTTLSAGGVSYLDVLSGVSGTAYLAAIEAAQNVGGVVNTTANQVLGANNKLFYAPSGSNENYIWMMVNSAASAYLSATNTFGLRIFHDVSSVATPEVGLKIEEGGDDAYLYVVVAGVATWLEPDGTTRYITAKTATTGGTPGLGVLAASYFAYFNSTTLAYTLGIDGTRTVKDGSGVNKTVTIQGGTDRRVGNLTEREGTLAADTITIDRSKSHGNQTVAAAGRLQEVTDLIVNLESQAQHMWDAGAYTTLESKFGLPAGSGANFLSLLGQVKTALGAAVLVEFCDRLAGQ